MAILNTPKAFDKALLSSDVKDGIEPLLDWLNQNFDQIIRAFPNQLTLYENVRGKLLSVKALHNTPLSIDCDRQNPTGIFILKSSAPIRSHSFEITSTGSGVITFRFDEPIPVLTRSFDTFIYDSDNVAQPAIGDTVSISGFGNKVNNGDFLVLENDAGRLTVFNLTGVTETKANNAFTGEREVAKNVDIFVLF